MAEITVEQALKELREMFPNTYHHVTVHVREHHGHILYRVSAFGYPTQQQWRDALSDCMVQVRKWKEENDGQ